MLDIKKTKPKSKQKKQNQYKTKSIKFKKKTNKPTSLSNPGKKKPHAKQNFSVN